MKSSVCWASAAWARCGAPRTRTWVDRSPSKSFLTRSPRNAERLARFEREEKTLAALSHANIAIIHGLEKIDGAPAIVMELVEGPTLADRIAMGPLPIEEALPIARQMSAALEAAPELGIVHRDLKPANVKVRQDGSVKVLDFGFAKALESNSPASADAAASPTITSPAMTQLGVILGTAAYGLPRRRVLRSRAAAQDDSRPHWCANVLPLVH